MSKKNNKLKSITSSTNSSFMTELQKMLTPEDLRKMFYASSFGIPSIEDSKFPKGYYNLIETFFSKENPYVINYGHGNYSIALEKEGGKNPVGFFMSIAQYFNGFTKDNVTLKSINIQKIPSESKKKKFHLDQCVTSSDMRLVLCIKSSCSENSVHFQLGPDHDRIDCFDSKSFGTCVPYNLSEISVPLTSNKSGSILPECYFIFIDFEPSAEIAETVKNKISFVDPRDPLKLVSKMMKKSGGVEKMMNTVKEKFGSNVEGILQSFTGQKQDQGDVKRDTEEMQTSYADGIKDDDWE